MKLLLVLVLLALPLVAATETATVTVPNAQAAELATVVESWIQAQVHADGSLKYPGRTAQARRTALLDSILRLGLRRVIRSACQQFPRDCPAPIQSAMEDKRTADSGVTSGIYTLIR